MRAHMVGDLGLYVLMVISRPREPRALVVYCIKLMAMALEKRVGEMRREETRSVMRKKDVFDQT